MAKTSAHVNRQSCGFWPINPKILMLIYHSDIDWFTWMVLSCRARALACNRSMFKVRCCAGIYIELSDVRLLLTKKVTCWERNATKCFVRMPHQQIKVQMFKYRKFCWYNHIICLQLKCRITNSAQRKFYFQKFKLISTEWITLVHDSWVSRIDNKLTQKKGNFFFLCIASNWFWLKKHGSRFKMNSH